MIKPKYADSNNAIRILHVVTIMDCGGIETRTMELMRHIDRNRYLFDFCVHKPQPGYYDQEITQLGGKVHNCGPLKNLPIFAYRFYKLLKTSNYDVVHCHVPTFAAVCLPIAKLLGIKKRIAHFRSTSNIKKQNFFHKLSRKFLARIACANATDIIGISSDVLNNWFGKQYSQYSRIHLVYNGINLTPFTCPRQPDWLRQEFDIPQSWQTVIHVGRFDPPKNHRKIISVAQAFLAQNPKTCFLLIGPGQGQLKQSIKKLVQQKNLTQNIRFPGLRTDIPQIMRSADALLFPSTWEGLGNVVIEAAAAGLPMVLSDLPAFHEILAVAGRAELLNPTAPDIDWAAALHNALAQKPDDTALGKFQNSPFALPNSRQALLSIYQS